MSQITIIAGEYDKEIPLNGDGSPTVVNDDAFPNDESIADDQRFQPDRYRKD